MAEFLISLDLILIALACWCLVARRWRGASASAVALIGSVPLVRYALAGEFRASAVLILLAALVIACALLLADWRHD